LAFTLFAGLLMLLLRREYVVIPMLAATFFITEMQRIVIFSLDFNMMRILIIFGWLRVILRNEYRCLQLNRIDRLIVGFSLVTIVITTLQWRTVDALVNVLGGAFNTLGLFFLFRILIRDFDNMRTIFVSLAVLCIPLAAEMLFESIVGRNLFSIFGGVPHFTHVRAGRLRAQGPFTHYILAGMFGATLVPLFVSLYRGDKSAKRFVVVGCTAAVAVVYLSASSGPVMALTAGVMALGMWYFRAQMRFIKLGVVASLLGLTMVMEAPVWALVARVGVVTGSTGWHRYALIDNFIRRFDEWFLLGLKSTAFWGEGLWDVTNHYIRVAVGGGLLGLLLFGAIIVLCFRTVGRVQKMRLWEKRTRWFVWCLGSALFAHTIAFLGISYFDQIIISWYLLLSMLATVRSMLLKDAVGLQQKKGVAPNPAIAWG